MDVLNLAELGELLVQVVISQHQDLFAVRLLAIAPVEAIHNLHALSDLTDRGEAIFIQQRGIVVQVEEQLVLPAVATTLREGDGAPSVRGSDRVILDLGWDQGGRRGQTEVHSFVSGIEDGTVLEVPEPNQFLEAEHATRRPVGTQAHLHLALTIVVALEIYREGHQVVLRRPDDRRAKQCGNRSTQDCPTALKYSEEAWALFQC
mmetsp:Transcript_45611/g.115881  ORF Transcript_45611/g.115881 Transcript_45611/m.115881 type:complete len:205 (-) Transcript_45611:67-681(-)